MKVDLGTCAGKHDLQLEKEMNEAFKAAGLHSEASFERRRGRVGLVIREANQEEETIQLFLLRHPDFRHNYDNPAIGSTQFKYFTQVLNMETGQVINPAPAK